MKYVSFIWNSGEGFPLIVELERVYSFYGKDCNWDYCSYYRVSNFSSNATICNTRLGINNLCWKKGKAWLKGWFRILAKGLRMPQHLGQGGSERQQHAEILISSYLGLSERLMHLLIRHLWFQRGSVFWSSLILLFDPSDVQVKKEKCRLVCCLKRLATFLSKRGPWETRT